jgi:hypothetical protein
MGLRERLVLLLQLREQPDVLNGNDRLIGEGLEERYLVRGKRLHLHSRHVDRSNRHAVAHHRNRQDRPIACLDDRRVFILLA